LSFRIEQQHSAVMDSAEWLWYNSAKLPRIGLAKPVTELLITTKMNNLHKEIL